MEGDRILASLRQPTSSTHPVEIGLKTEAAVTARLLRRGFKVLQPCGFNHRYDLVLDLDGEFVRVQIKTGRLRRGRVVFKTSSVTSNTHGSASRCYDAADIDVFLVYCEETDGIYAVPVAQASRGEMCLRVARTGNGQEAGIRWASEYAVPA